MRSMAAFLQRVEASNLPVRVHELQIASRTENTDDLTLQMRVSTMWEDAKPAKQLELASEKEKP